MKIKRLSINSKQFKPRKNERVILFLAALVFAVFGYLAAQWGLFGERALSGLNAHIIDVWQGDAILLTTPSGAAILIDAGPRSAGSDVCGYLIQQGINRIDVLIATHPHEDHIGGIPEVMAQFPVGEVYMPDAITTTNTFSRLLDAIEAAGLEISLAEAGVVFWEENELKAEFISPEKAANYSNLNDMSAVALISYGEIRFLFTGDAEARAEADMVLKKSELLRADLLKVGHHGSNTSTTEDFLAAVDPAVAVISCGAGNSYGHPAAQTLTRLDKYAAVYRTDQDGTVVVNTDGQRLRVKTGGR